MEAVVHTIGEAASIALARREGHEIHDEEREAYWLGFQDAAEALVFVLADRRWWKS